MADQKPVRIALGEKDFSTLVNGGTVRVEEGEVAVELILSDLGFEVMGRVLERAKRQE